MAANTPATSAHQPQGWLSKEEGEARSAIATDESQLKAKSQQLQGEANQAIATDQSALMQKDEDLVTRYAAACQQRYICWQPLLLAELRPPLSRLALRGQVT